MPAKKSAKKNPVGAPPKYGPEILKKLEKLLNEWPMYITKEVAVATKDGKVVKVPQERANHIPLMTLIADELGVSRVTIWRWMNEHKELCNLLNTRMRLTEDMIVLHGLHGDYNPKFSGTYAANRLGWKGEGDGKKEHVLESQFQFYQLIQNFALNIGEKKPQIPRQINADWRGTRRSTQYRINQIPQAYPLNPKSQKSPRTTYLETRRPSHCPKRLKSD
jgi:hypothetical protein